MFSCVILQREQAAGLRGQPAPPGQQLELRPQALDLRLVRGQPRRSRELVRAQRAPDTAYCTSLLSSPAMRRRLCRLSSEPVRDPGQSDQRVLLKRPRRLYALRTTPMYVLGGGVANDRTWAVYVISWRDAREIWTMMR
jgi:hypothetical protein